MSPISEHEDTDLTEPPPVAPTKHFITVRSRQVLIAFLFTFIAARVLVYLIMAQKMPDLYLHLNNSLHYAGKRLSPRLKRLELNGPQ